MTAGRGRRGRAMVIPVPFFLSLSFSWPPRESSPRPHSGFLPAGENDREKGSDNNRTGFPPTGENDGGCCVFFMVSFSWPPRESSYETCGVSRHRRVSRLTGWGRGQDWIPGQGPRMTAGRGRRGGRWSFPRLFSFRCHSRGRHGNPVLDRILDSRLLARMTAGVVYFLWCHSRGCHGNPVMKPAA